MKHIFKKYQLNSTHLVAFLAAIWLFFAFWSLKKTSNTFFINFIPPWNRSSKGELNFWIGSLLFLSLSSGLFGYALAPMLKGLGAALWQRWSALRRRPFLLILGGITLAAIVMAYVGNRLILMGYPVTDDEHAIRFGGQCLAQGKLGTELGLPKSSIPSLFLYFRGGWVTSMDWLGGQLAWAIAEVTRLGTLFFSLLNALPVLLLGLHISRKISKPWGLVAALTLLISPMFFTLGITTHAMMVSRSLMALSIFLYFKAEERETFLWWFAAGFAMGLSFITRPFEAAFILLPFALFTAYRFVRSPKTRWRMVAGLSLGFAIPAALLLLHSYMVTGDPLKPARLSVRRPSKAYSFDLLYKRFGANQSYNLLQMMLWFLGPLGVLFVVLGVMQTRATRLLGLSLLSFLALALFHDDHGIHMVGPIHYADALFPLAIIATHGAHALFERLKTHAFNPPVWAVAMGVALLISQGTYIYKYARSIHASAAIHHKVYSAIEKQSARGSVILAPQFARVWLKTPKLGWIASWVFEWRRPRPDLTDSRLILHWRRHTLKALRERFPKRTFYRLTPVNGPPYLKLKKL